MAPPPRPRERRPPPKGGVAPTRPSPLLPGAEPSGAHVTCPPPASPPCCFSLPSAPGGGAAGPRRSWASALAAVSIRGQVSGRLAGAEGLRVSEGEARRGWCSCAGARCAEGSAILPRRSWGAGGLAVAFPPVRLRPCASEPRAGGVAGCARRRWVRARLGAGRVA